MDRGGEVSVVTCTLCGTSWLHYLIEQEAFTASGRWYRGLLSSSAPSVAPNTAVEYLESLPWYFAGGSYYNSSGFRRSGEIHP